MDLRAVDYFLAIADTGSISRAAEKLFISEPALSQYLRRLEKELGVTLVMRGQNSAMTLTEAGVCFRDSCRTAADLRSSMREDLERIRLQKQNRLLVGCTATYLQAWLPNSRTESFLAETQDIDIVLNRADLLEQMLLSQKIDLILGALDLKNPQLTYEVAQSRELDLSVSKNHPLAKYSYRLPGNSETRITLSDAAPYPFALLEKGTVIRHLCDEYFRRQDFQPVTVQEFRRSADVWIKLIISNAVGFLSQEEPEHQIIVPVALDPPMYYQTGAAYRKGEKLPPVLRKLISLHREDVSSHCAAARRD